MSKTVFLLGGGGHARVVLDALLSSAVSVAGVLDPRLQAGDRLFGVAVIGGDEVLDRVDPGEALLVNGLGANPSVCNRMKLFKALKVRGFLFADVRHPSAVIGSECVWGEGWQIMAGAVIQNRSRIGDNVVINTGAIIEHDCVLGGHSFVAPGAVLSGSVSVRESTFVGASAVVLPGIEIGANAVIGAGAVVAKDVPDGWIVAGSPAVKFGMNE